MAPVPEPLVQFTESLSPFPALNLGWLEALIDIGSPVRGLRPVEALRLATEKVPKPTSRTSSPFFKAFEIDSNTLSTALEAWVLESPLASATAPIRSFLFIVLESPNEISSSRRLRLTAHEAARLTGFSSLCQSETGLAG